MKALVVIVTMGMGIMAIVMKAMMIMTALVLTKAIVLKKID